MAAKRGTQEFTVRLEGFSLDDREMNRLNNVVQKAILSEFARLDFIQDDLIVRFPREWLGIWIRPGELGMFDR